MCCCIWQVYQMSDCQNETGGFSILLWHKILGKRLTTNAQKRHYSWVNITRSTSPNYVGGQCFSGVVLFVRSQVAQSGRLLLVCWCLPLVSPNHPLHFPRIVQSIRYVKIRNDVKIASQIWYPNPASRYSKTSPCLLIRYPSFSLLASREIDWS